MKKQASKSKGLLDDGEEELQLTINEDFAKQYERKKKSEEVTQGAAALSTRLIPQILTQICKICKSSGHPAN